MEGPGKQALKPSICFPLVYLVVMTALAWTVGDFIGFSSARAL